MENNIFTKYCLVCGKELTLKQKTFCSRVCSFYQYSYNLKNEVYGHYCKDNIPKCELCGITDLDMLVLDHVDDNGAEHRRIVGGGGYNMNLWLRRNDYPSEWKMQVLCCNHNNKKELVRKAPKKAYRTLMTLDDIEQLDGI